MSLSNNNEDTMDAWQFTNHSKSSREIEDNLTLNNIPIPTPSPRQHLVKVIAASLNPADYKRFEGALGLLLWLFNRNAIPALDYAGRVIIPAAGSQIRAGQIVFGVSSASPFSGQGPLSEYAVVDKDFTIVAPQSLDPEQVAGVTVAGISAYQSILTHAKSGQRIFINGGSGGTGIFGVQIAKASGLHVTATCSTGNVELVRSLGADEIVDYKAVDSLVETLQTKKPFDLVVDNAGYDWDLYWKAHLYTKPGAPYVMVAGGWLGHYLTSLQALAMPSFLGGGRRPYKTFFPQPKLEHVRQIAEWMAQRKIKMVVDSTFEFQDVPAAFKRLKSGRARGKIVINVGDRATE